MIVYPPRIPDSEPTRDLHAWRHVLAGTTLRHPARISPARSGANVVCAIAADTLIFLPFPTPIDITVPNLRTRCTFAVGGKLYGVAIYEAEDGENGDLRPTKLIAQANSLPMAVQWNDGAIGASLDAGKYYYAAIVADNALNLAGFSGGYEDSLGWEDADVTGASLGVAGWTAAHVYVAGNGFPDPAPAVTLYKATNIPAIFASGW